MRRGPDLRCGHDPSVVHSSSARNPFSANYVTKLDSLRQGKRAGDMLVGAESRHYNRGMLDRATFFGYVRQAFAHLDDRPYLLAHPLAALLGRPGEVASPEALRNALLGAAEQLRPLQAASSGSANWRRWRYLALRYVEGLSTREIAHQLQVSERQALRDHQAGMEAVAAVLWARYRDREEARGRPEGSELGTSPGSVPAVRPPLQDGLEAELARVSALSPGETTNLVEALESALATVRGLAEARGARFQVSFPEDIHPVAVHPTVLRQVLLCLCSAVLEEGLAREIHVGVANAGDRVQLTLAVGPGPAGQPGAPVAAGGGAMLVDTARRLAEAQGGRLRVERAHKGHRQLSLELPMTRGVTILVIDDNPDVVQLFRWYLGEHNYRLVQARTPRAALELAHELRPDVITLDVMIPSQDGWQILHQLRSDPDVRDIPVIVCSILPEEALARSLGVADFLAKPVTRQSLLTVLERCLGARRSAGRRDYSEGTPSALPPLGHPAE